MTPKPRSVTALLVAALLRPAQAVDLLPTDVIAPPPGITTVQLSYLSSRRGDLYRDGVRQRLDTRLTVDQLQLRVGRAFAWRAHPSFAYAQLAERHLEPGGALSSLERGSGLGDLTLVLATWPYADRENGRYAAVAGYVILPTGSYDARRTLSLNTNPGENRYQAAVQAGYSHRLGSRGKVMTAFDVQWFGDNDAYRRGAGRIGTLEQHLLYNWQVAFSYTPAARLTLGLSYFYSQGGASRIDDAPWGGALRMHRYALTGLIKLPFGSLILQYGGDLKNDNGLFEDQRFAIRVLTIF